MNKKRLLIIFLVIGLVIIFWSFNFLQTYFKQAEIFLRSYGNIYPLLSILIFIVLSILSAMLVSFSSVWLVPVAIALWNAPLTVLFLVVGWLVGAIFSYFIGYYGGYPLAKKFVLSERLDYYHNLIVNKLSFGIIFLFRLTLPSEIPGYVLGIVRYPFIKYLLITFLAEWPYAVYAVYAIDSIINKKPIIFFISIIIWIIATWLLVYVYKKIKNNSIA